MAPKPLHLGALLFVVGALLVSLHLVPGPHPYAALLAVKLLLVLAIIVALGVKLGRHVVKPLVVEEPLLVGP